MTMPRATQEIRPPAKIRFRRRPKDEDRKALRRLVDAADVFYREERAIALELLDERLRQGPKSGYRFLFAEANGKLVGYTAWGPIPLTRGSFDLYWIVVDPHWQGIGLGRTLLARTEAQLAAYGGGRLYIETSSRDEYARTRRFYRRAGYRQVARLRDFYADGDDKIVYCKAVVTQ